MFCIRLCLSRQAIEFKFIFFAVTACTTGAAAAEPSFFRERR
jgi:hypothetical protein